MRSIWQAEAERAGKWSDRWVRGLPTAVVIGWLMLVGVPLAVIGPKLHGAWETAFLLLLTIDAACIVVGAFAWLTTIAFSWPVFAVPPPLRSRRHPKG